VQNKTLYTLAADLDLLYCHNCMYESCYISK